MARREDARNLWWWRSGALLAGAMAVGLSPAELQLANTVIALTFWVLGAPLVLGLACRLGGWCPHA